MRQNAIFLFLKRAFAHFLLNLAYENERIYDYARFDFTINFKNLLNWSFYQLSSMNESMTMHDLTLR